VAAGKSPYLD